MARLMMIFSTLVVVVGFNNCASELDYSKLQTKTTNSDGGSDRDNQSNNPPAEEPNEPNDFKDPSPMGDEESPQGTTSPSVSLSAPNPQSGGSNTVFTYDVFYVDADSANLTAGNVDFTGSDVTCDPPIVVEGESLSPQILVSNCRGSGRLVLSIAGGVAKDAAGNLSLQSEVSSPAAVVNLTCPDNFVLVPGDTGLGTQDFCVSKFEMKGARGDISAAAAGAPLVNLSPDDAFIECANMSDAKAEGGRFALISNAEWMTIARNIEGVAGNWSGSAVGSGALSRGWAAHIEYGDGWTNSGPAPRAGGDCLYNKAQDTCGSSGDHLFKRVLTLSTGDAVWDVAGNVYEWVDWDAADDGFTTGPTSCETGFHEMSSSSCAALRDDEYKPLGSFDSSHGVGQWFGSGGSGDGAATRGGTWDHGSRAGAFLLKLSDGPLNADTDTGFRCVYRAL